MTANGTLTHPVTFTTAASDGLGTWSGLKSRTNATSLTQVRVWRGDLELERVFNGTKVDGLEVAFGSFIVDGGDTLMRKVAVVSGGGLKLTGGFSGRIEHMYALQGEVRRPVCDV